MLFNAICQVKEGTVSEMLGTQLGVLEPPSHSLLKDPGQVCDVLTAQPHFPRVGMSITTGPS